MRCPKCQFENREEAKYCNECGHKFELTCPECESHNRFGSKFCNECDFDISIPREVSSINYSEPQSYTPKYLVNKILNLRSSIEGERKLVTVLFADVANYTAMSEKLDPEEVHQIMDGCFRILMSEIHRLEGTINQFTGDGVMALFGAPISHEDHAHRACYAALSIQSELTNYSEKIWRDYHANFKMRIGLNSGTVVVASIGDDLRMDYTAIGDTTNLAARMESKADPGKIILSGATHKLVKDFFEFKSLGNIFVKGKEQPQVAYELIKVGNIETRIRASVARGLTKFVGRKKSMAALKTPYELALSGRGQVVGIVGEAGVGKSRLLLEFINQLPHNEYTYLEGHCLHYGEVMSYLPIIDIVKSYFDIKEGDQESGIKNKLEETIGKLDNRLYTSLPPLQELLSLPVDDEKYLQLDSGEKKIRVFESIRDLFLRESERKPLVLAIEDLHWIDKTSEECLGFLIDWFANARILLILLYRIEYTHQWKSKSYYSKIGLTQLGTLSSSQLVQAILEGGDVVPELRDLILSRAGGNPLYVEEFTHNLLENGLIDRKDRTYVLTRSVTEIQVPDTIQGIISARIDRLEENMKRVMQVASVIGREFAFRILQTIMGMREELISLLRNLQGLEFISEKRLLPELEYIFKHALTQEVAYNSLLQKRKKIIHESIGKAIESLYAESIEEYYELLAYHFGKSDNAVKTFKYLFLANQKAAKIIAMEDALSYFYKAMKTLDNLPDSQEKLENRISLIVNNNIVFQMLFKFSEYYDLLTNYKPVVSGLLNKGLLGTFYTCMSHCEWWFGKYDQAKENANKGLELCEVAAEFKGASFSFSHLIFIYAYKAEYDVAINLKKDALRMFKKQFNLRWYVWALVAVSLAYAYLGRWKEAIAEGSQALQISEEYENNSMISCSAMILSILHTWSCDTSNGLEYGKMAVEKAPTPVDKLWAQGALAWSWIRDGEPDKGIEVFENLLPMAKATKYAFGEIYFSMMLSEGYCLAGSFEKASKILEETLELAKRDKMKYYVGYVHRLLGEIALETNPPHAAPHFEKSISVNKEIKAENELALAYAGYGRYYRQKNDIVYAREYLTKALDILERLGTLIEPEKVRKDLSELPMI